MTRSTGNPEGGQRPSGPGEAARRLDVSVRTVQRWLRDGRLPAVRVGDRLKVDPAAFAAPRAKAASGVPSTGQRPIRTLLVANRGEIVPRIARTCRRLGVRCLALVPPDQAGAWWTSQADGTVPLAGTYLDAPAILAAARAAGADAIHPGYGFLAESAAFAETVASAGLTWVGPPPGAMRAMGDKPAARRLAGRVGVPVLPGSDRRAQSDRALAREAGRIGYPVLVKPAAGGGGKGMHLVRGAGELHEALARARREAAAGFGDDRLLLERYLDGPRHVEVQILFDRYGAGVALGERECSLQRRHQKVVEEAPSPAVTPALRARLEAAALAVAAAAGYAGAGTVEFLLDGASGDFFFLEMNARLQVEHPVTEAVTGRDLVADQLAIAAGAPLAALAPPLGPDTTVARHGHAIEARLYAEDPEADFLPAAGLILRAEWPSGEGIRVDAGVAPGDKVATRYDPLQAKIVAWGDDRSAAVRRLGEALAATSVLGVVTNLPLLRWIAGSDWFAAGQTATDTIALRWHPAPAERPDETWLTAAAAALAARNGTGWRLNGPARLRLALGEEERTVESPDPAGWPASSLPVTLAPDGRTAHMDVGGRSVAVAFAPPPTVESAVLHAHRGRGDARRVIAPMPGIVLAIAARAGRAVAMHEPLLTLEAMKMENVVAAPADGVVGRVLVRLGQAVQRGEALIELE